MTRGRRQRKGRNVHVVRHTKRLIIPVCQGCRDFIADGDEVCRVVEGGYVREYCPRCYEAKQ